MVELQLLNNGVIAEGSSQEIVIKYRNGHEEENFVLKKSRYGEATHSGVDFNVLTSGLELQEVTEQGNILTWNQDLIATKIDGTQITLTNTQSGTYYSGNFKGSKQIPGTVNLRQQYVYSGTKKYSVPLDANGTYKRIWIKGTGQTTSVYISGLKLYAIDGWSGTFEEAALNGYISPMAFRNDTTSSTSYLWDTTNLFTGGSTNTKMYPEVFLYIKPLITITHLEFYSNTDFSTTYDYLAIHETEITKISNIATINYSLSGTRTTKPITLNGVADGTETIKWVSDVPTGTNLTVECAITDLANMVQYESGNFTNVALGKSVTGTVALTNATLITDGNTATDPYASCAAGLNAITIDLGSVKQISTIKVWHYYSDSRTYYGTKTESSEDGVTWEVVYDSAVSGTYAESSAGKTYTFTKRNIRYIRDWLNGSTANTGNHWVEIQALEAEMLYQAPEDTSFIVATNDAIIPGITVNDDLTNKFLWIREKLNTTDATITPKLNRLVAYYPIYPLDKTINVTFKLDRLKTYNTPKYQTTTITAISDNQNISWTPSYLITDKWYLNITTSDGDTKTWVMNILPKRAYTRTLYQYVNVGVVVNEKDVSALYQYVNVIEQLTRRKFAQII